MWLAAAAASQIDENHPLYDVATGYNIWGWKQGFVIVFIGVTMFSVIYLLIYSYPYSQNKLSSTYRSVNSNVSGNSSRSRLRSKAYRSESNSNIQSLSSASSVSSTSQPVGSSAGGGNGGGGAATDDIIHSNNSAFISRWVRKLIPMFTTRHSRDTVTLNDTNAPSVSTHRQSGNVKSIGNKYGTTQSTPNLRGHNNNKAKAKSKPKGKNKSKGGNSGHNNRKSVSSTPKPRHKTPDANHRKNRSSNKKNNQTPNKRKGRRANKSKTPIRENLESTLEDLALKNTSKRDESTPVSTPLKNDHDLSTATTVVATTEHTTTSHTTTSMVCSVPTPPLQLVQSISNKSSQSQTSSQRSSSKHHHNPHNWVSASVTPSISSISGGDADDITTTAPVYVASTESQSSDQSLALPIFKSVLSNKQKKKKRIARAKKHHNRKSQHTSISNTPSASASVTTTVTESSQTNTSTNTVVLEAANSVATTSTASENGTPQASMTPKKPTVPPRIIPKLGALSSPQAVTPTANPVVELQPPILPSPPRYNIAAPVANGVPPANSANIDKSAPMNPIRPPIKNAAPLIPPTSPKLDPPQLPKQVPPTWDNQNVIHLTLPITNRSFTNSSPHSVASTSQSTAVQSSNSTNSAVLSPQPTPIANGAPPPPTIASTLPIIPPIATLSAVHPSPAFFNNGGGSSPFQFTTDLPKSTISPREPPLIIDTSLHNPSTLIHASSQPQSNVTSTTTPKHKTSFNSQSTRPLANSAGTSHRNRKRSSGHSSKSSNTPKKSVTPSSKQTAAGHRWVPKSNTPSGQIDIQFSNGLSRDSSISVPASDSLDKPSKSLPSSEQLRRGTKPPLKSGSCSNLAMLAQIPISATGVTADTGEETVEEPISKSSCISEESTDTSDVVSEVSSRQARKAPFRAQHTKQMFDDPTPIIEVMNTRIEDKKEARVFPMDLPSEEEKVSRNSTPAAPQTSSSSTNTTDLHQPEPRNSSGSNNNHNRSPRKPPMAIPPTKRGMSTGRTSEDDTSDPSTSTQTSSSSFEMTRSTDPLDSTRDGSTTDEHKISENAPDTDTSSPTVSAPPQLEMNKEIPIVASAPSITIPNNMSTALINGPINLMSPSSLNAQAAVYQPAPNMSLNPNLNPLLFLNNPLLTHAPPGHPASTASLPNLAAFNANSAAPNITIAMPDVLEQQLMQLKQLQDTLLRTQQHNQQQQQQQQQQAAAAHRLPLVQPFSLPLFNPPPNVNPASANALPTMSEASLIELLNIANLPTVFLPPAPQQPPQQSAQNSQSGSGVTTPPKNAVQKPNGVIPNGVHNGIPNAMSPPTFMTRATSVPHINTPHTQQQNAEKSEEKQPIARAHSSATLTKAFKPTPAEAASRHQHLQAHAQQQAFPLQQMQPPQQLSHSQSQPPPPPQHQQQIIPTIVPVFIAPNAATSMLPQQFTTAQQPQQAVPLLPIPPQLLRDMTPQQQHDILVQFQNLQRQFNPQQQQFNAQQTQLVQLLQQQQQQQQHQQQQQQQRSSQQLQSNVNQNQNQSQQNS